MPNTYTQLYIHFVFAVKYRKAIIGEDWEDRLQKYITGIVQNNGHKLLAINTMPDHLHLFAGLNPKQSISELMRLVKGDSSEFINSKGLTSRKFYWQEGYGAFSYSRSHVAKVTEYVLNQEEHYQKKTFLEEYHQFLDQFEVAYDERYIFKGPE